MADSISRSSAAASSGSGSYCDEAVKWKSISLTHVEYIKGDVLGHLLAMSSLLPFCLGVSFVTLIVFRRDLHTISFFTGLVLDEAFNLVLKHLIQEERPNRDKQNLYTEYGMPSSHSQFMSFFAIYMTFFIWIRVYRNYSILDDLWKVVVCVGSFFTAFIVAYSRVYLEYHTPAQVVMGSLVGVVAGSLWFAFVQLVLTPIFPHLASSPMGEFLMLRDSTLIPHVLWFEYTSSRSEARSAVPGKGLAVSLCEVTRLAVSLCEVTRLAVSLCEATRLAVSLCEATRLAVSLCEVTRLAVSLCEVTCLAVSPCEVTCLAVSPCKVTRLAVSLCEVTRLAVSLCEATRLAVSLCEVTRLAVSLCEVTRLAVSLCEVTRLFWGLVDASCTGFPVCVRCFEAL
ncbi:hypothetical protein ACOMHN_027481 [Nucella lapillus]